MSNSTDSFFLAFPRHYCAKWGEREKWKPCDFSGLQSKVSSSPAEMSVKLSPVAVVQRSGCSATLAAWGDVESVACLICLVSAPSFIMPGIRGLHNRQNKRAANACLPPCTPFCWIKSGAIQLKPTPLAGIWLQKEMWNYPLCP